MIRLRTVAAAALASALFTAPASAQSADACFIRNATMEEAMARQSPFGMVGIAMGDQEATLCYGRPSANGREIMGGLVPFDALWRTGANEATAIHLPFDAEIGGTEVPAGSYSIFTRPTAEGWTFYISTEWERWGVPINDAARDGVVAEVTRPTAETDEMVETFTISWDAHGAMMGHLVFEWENTRVELPIHMAGMSHGG